MVKSMRDRVFLSYAKENLDKARDVYDGMKQRRLNVWFDDKDIMPDPWKPQIVKSISKSCYLVICISEAALRKTGDERPGFQDEELNRAYKIAEKQSSQDFTIVPVRLEECSRGDFHLSSFQQYDLFKDFENGLDKLAVHLGSYSLSDGTAKDERTKDEKTIEHLMGKVQTAFLTAEYNKSIAILNSVLALKPDSCEALNNLGLVWKFKGEYDKTIEYCEKALKSGIKSFGEEHPDVARSRNTQGEIWRAKGEYDKAIEYHEKALKSNIKAFGENHPNVAKDWNNLGLGWHSKGEYDKTIEYCEKALSVFKVSLGNDHPYTKSAENNLTRHSGQT